MHTKIYTAPYWEELAKESGKKKKKKHYQALTDFMTPIVKAFCADTGFTVCERAMQCLGGYGYCKDYPIEQCMRDAKIMSLYEGTNGIQSIDLMGRKMRLQDGAAYKAFVKEINAFIEAQKDHEGLGAHVMALSAGLERVRRMADEMAVRSKTDPLQWASYTYPALLCFGELTMTWRLLDMAAIAWERSNKKGKKNEFFKGKVFQATFYADTTLPHTIARASVCTRDGREILDIPDGAF